MIKINISEKLLHFVTDFAEITVQMNTDSFHKKISLTNDDNELLSNAILGIDKIINPIIEKPINSVKKTILPKGLKREAKMCEVCGTSFIPKNNHQRMCSRKCASTSGLSAKKAKQNKDNDSKLKSYYQPMKGNMLTGFKD